MILSDHFTLLEFTESDTARRLHIVNDLPIDLLEVARKTAAMLERIRSRLGSVAMTITSGYRCRDLNRAIGSLDTSDHLRALAADFRAPAFGTPLEVALTLSPLVDELGIGQLIYEHTWCHVSTRDPDRASNRILTVAGRSYVAGITSGLA